ncbi:MAG: formate dehydrogenase family accessory protein FdhD [Rhodocyclales bacterium GWA2_65_19]|nr:MAG: formate dehydrogenase family accessory protein FdhD [Rhodocyclales bacterium GWA2_65_19]
MNAPERHLVLSHAGRPPTFAIKAINAAGETVSVAIPCEHPLTLYVDKREVVTLMTLGGDPEALTLGYLRNQQLIDALDDIASVQVDWEVNAVAVTTRSGSGPAAARLERRTITSGCGQGTMFGAVMDGLAPLQLPAATALSASRLHRLIDAVRERQCIYRQAGSVHGCALARNTDETELLYFIEDVGRHNAVDAIAGRMWLDGEGGADKIFHSTGRLTSEMVIKAAQMGIPFLVSRSGVTQMAWEIAQRLGLTLIGRARNRQYLIYTGAERFLR